MNPYLIGALFAAILVIVGIVCYLKGLARGYLQTRFCARHDLLLGCPACRGIVSPQDLRLSFEERKRNGVS